MDSNGHRFWLLADQSQFALPADGVMWNGADRTLQLGGRALEVPVAARNRTLQLAARPKVAVDRFGAVAWYDVATQTVLAGLRDQNPEPLVTLSSNDEVLDLVCNALGTLVLLVENGSGQRRVGFLSTRSTWDGLVELPLAGGHDHLIDLGDERFLALRTDGKNPLLIEGKPLAEGLSRTYSDAIFQPDEKNPTPPRTKKLADLKLQNTDRIVATASRPGRGGAALVLSSNDTTKLIVVDGKGVPQIADVPDIALAYDVSWTNRNELVVFVEGHDRAAPLQVIEGDDWFFKRD